MQDAPAKAEHAVRLMQVAAQLADAAPSDRQQRIVARYALLAAEPAVFWLGRWKKVLEDAGDDATARRAKAPLKRLRQEWTRQKTIRDKLAAKRQQVAERRDEDLQGTLKLWSQLTRSGVRALCTYAVAASEALGSPRIPTQPIAATTLVEVETAFLDSRLDPATVYTDVTSYAAGERNLLAVTVSGQSGRRIMQINDVHAHLDVLYSLRSFAAASDVLALLLRSALIVEVCNLIELSVGPAKDDCRYVKDPPLRNLIEPWRAEDGQDLLGDLDSSIQPAGRREVRYLRQKVAAHLDRRLSFAEIKAILTGLDVEGLFRQADILLDWLDAASVTHVDLGLLVLGHRALTDLKPAAGPTSPAVFQSAAHRRTLDSPYAAMVAGGFGPASSARIAGVIAGRVKNPRDRWYKDEEIRNAA